MIGPVFRRRVRLERAGALTAGLRTLAEYMRPGYVVDVPYICGRGHITGRVHPVQYADIEARRNPACRARTNRRRCGLPLMRYPVRALFRAAAEQITPDVSADALERIRVGIEKANGAPGQGGADLNNDDQLREPTS